MGVCALAVTIPTMANFTFIDSHCHLDSEKIPCLPEALSAAQALGVGQFIVPGLYPSQWPIIARMADQHPSVRFAVGVHPWWLESAATEPSAIESLGQQLTQHASAAQCVAIGETGIDGLRGASSAIQSAWFEVHVEVARQLDKPLIVHAVRSHQAVMAVLRKFKGQVCGVIHGFAGSAEVARQYWQLGFYLGVGGTITYARAKKTRQAVIDLPLDAILLETDSPDMPLCGRQGEINLPCYIPEVAQCLAELKGLSVTTVANATTANCQRLFAL